METGLQKELLQEIIRNFCHSLHSIGKSFEMKEVKLKYSIYLDLLSRIRHNLEGFYNLMVFWNSDNGLRQPLALTLRGSLTDAINGLYLSTFHENDEAFRAEVLAISFAYIGYFKKAMAHLDIEFPYMSREEVDKNAKEFKNIFFEGLDDEIREAASESGKVYSKLREDSPDELFYFRKPSKPTENIMFDQIRSNPKTRHCAHLYLLQRYFSQYQHYSYYGQKLKELEPRFEFDRWVKSMYMLHEAVWILANLLPTEKTHLDALSANFNLFKLFNRNE